MKAIILAAGEGTRLHPLTKRKPKCLVQVYGQPLLEYQIRAYVAAGLTERDIAVVAGYDLDQVNDYLQATHPEVMVIDNPDYAATNNMYSLHLALEELLEPRATQAVIIANGDCIYEPGIVNKLVTSVEDNLIAVDQGTYLDESMKITVNNSTITDISKEIPRADAHGVSIDLYKISAASAHRLQAITTDYIINRREQRLWTEVALRDLLRHDRFAPLNIDGRTWVEIDNLADLRQADTLFASLDSSKKRCFVVDLDGTVYLGRKPITETVTFIRDQCEKREFYFLTNNTSKTPHEYVTRLKDLGIATDSDHILSPYQPLRSYLEEEKLVRLLPVANGAFTEYVSRLLPEVRWTMDAAECQAVIVAYDTELTYDKLRAASLALHSNDIPLLATHCDKVCPTELGNVPDIGSILALLETATGRTPDRTFGKPNPAMLDVVREKYADEEIVMAGDRLYTDHVLAKNAGVDFILVLSGETTRFDVDDLDDFPQLIVDHLGALND